MKKYIYILSMCTAAMFATSCIGDLDQYPHEDITSESVYTSLQNYKSVLGKIYVSMVTKGQEKDGNEDLSSNRGEDYMRCYFNLQEVGTDEVAYTWLSGENLTDISNLSWDANAPWVADMYYRIYYNIALCNEFLRNATDEKISGFTESERNEIVHYRAETRFMRALFYYHAMDLFRNIPFVTENDPVGSYIPPRYMAKDMFGYIESELKAIENDLLSKDECPYGRASKGAAYTLLAKLYLNAKTYISETRYNECVAACQSAIGQGYSLEIDVNNDYTIDCYRRLFNADNHLRTNEIIFTLPVDANTTVSWGSSTYMVCGAISQTSATQNPADYGVTKGWGSMRICETVSGLFDDNDKRGGFYTIGQTPKVTSIEDASTGYLSTKWTNLTDNGEAASNTDQSGVNTDYPLFRLADVYLMYAEATARGGNGDMTTAVGYVNALRERAFGDNSQDITETDLTENNFRFFLDERARELYWECTRRTDLIRFNLFTTADYLWEFKGGVSDGTSVESKYNYYPIPSAELTANPNLKNEEY